MKELKTTLLECNTVNRNGVTYDRGAIEKALEEYQTRIDRGTSVITYGQNDNEDKIDLNLIAGVITDIKIDGDNVIGTIKTIMTPEGARLKNIIKHGTPEELHYGARGWGTIEDGVVKEFKLSHFNIISDDSK
jgi:hypothetical protein